MKRIFLTVIAFFGLSACVEVKDPDQEPQVQRNSEKPLFVEYAPQLIVDQPLYLFEGRVLTQSQWEAEGRLPQPGRKIVYDYDVVQIGDGAVLYTLGQDVRLNVKKMTSLGSIATFPPGLSSPQGEAGHHGGALDLRIEEAEGRVQFFLRGTSGGQGIDGKAPDEALRGKKGEDLPHVVCGDPRLERVLGGRGKPGYGGGDGMPGGNSGQLHLTIRASSDFIYTIKKEVGKGGKFGNGHPQGGPGGYSGVNSCHMIQPYVDPSLVGGPGLDGKPGKDGLEEAAYINDQGQKLIQ